MIGGDDAAPLDDLEEAQGGIVMLVPVVGAGDEERGVGEDQGSGFDGP
jgi:hypothetical protein